MIEHTKMKIKYPSLRQEKRRSSMDSAEAGCECGGRKASRKPFPISNCIIIALSVVSLLSLGIYFILIDLKILSSVLNATDAGNLTEFSWTESDSFWSEEASGNGTGTKADGMRKSGNDEKAVVVLESDAGGGKLVQQTDGEEAQGSSWASTTAKAFVYSPTVPLAVRSGVEAESTTDDEGLPDGTVCFSTRIGFCEGILPYDLVRLPAVANVTGYEDLELLLPHFRRFVESGCSPRARELICSVLEPECQPVGSSGTFPCRANCRAVAEECGDVISSDPALSDVFDCGDSRKWDQDSGCVDLFRGDCRQNEFECPEGSCIPLRWLCDGTNDCERSASDEIHCESYLGDGFR